MTLEDLIYTRLSDPTGPAAKLARYGDAPAIFYQVAPEDTAAGWDGKRQYPRIDYTVDMQANGVGRGDVHMKNIRNTRRREQSKHHRDYMKEGTSRE